MIAGSMKIISSFSINFYLFELVRGNSINIYDQYLSNNQGRVVVGAYQKNNTLEDRGGSVTNDIEYISAQLFKLLRGNLNIREAFIIGRKLKNLKTLFAISNQFQV